MKYTGDKRRETVTLELSFIDGPVNVPAMHALSLRHATMMGDEARADLALSEFLPDDFAHILLNYANRHEVEEFFEQWSEASNNSQGPSSLEDVARRLFGR